MDHRLSTILFVIALGLLSAARAKKEGLFREPLCNKRASVASAEITVAFSLLLVRIYQYQIQNRD